MEKNPLYTYNNNNKKTYMWKRTKTKNPKKLQKIFKKSKKHKITILNYQLLYPLDEQKERKKKSKKKTLTLLTKLIH